MVFRAQPDWEYIQCAGECGVLVVKKLGTGFIVTCLVAMGIGYAMCVGLGTVYFRLAFAKRQESNL